MDLVTNLVCPCNNKTYKTEASLKAHRKTQGHQYWEQIKEQKKQYYNENKEKINQRRKELYKLKKLQKQEQEQQPTGP